MNMSTNMKLNFLFAPVVTTISSLGFALGTSVNCNIHTSDGATTTVTKSLVPHATGESAQCDLYKDSSIDLSAQSTSEGDALYLLLPTGATLGSNASSAHPAHISFTDDATGVTYDYICSFN